MKVITHYQFCYVYLGNVLYIIMLGVVLAPAKGVAVRVASEIAKNELMFSWVGLQGSNLVSLATVMHACASVCES